LIFTDGQLFTIFYFILDTNPNQAIQSGLHNYTEEIEDRTEDGVRKIHDKCKQFHEEATSLLAETGDDNKEKFFLKMLEREVRQCLKWKDHKGYLFAEGAFLYGLQTSLPNLFESSDVLLLESICSTM
jgi:hypothetical protein